MTTTDIHTLEAEIATLQKAREETNFSYENSSWRSGPKYREELAAIDYTIDKKTRELDALKAAA